MPHKTSAANRILIASNDPPELLDRYCTARNPQELQRSLHRHADTLELAVVFTDFDLAAEQARAICRSLPYILVDSWRQGEQEPERPGIGVLLAGLTYFDRLTVLTDSRWAQWQAQYGLHPVNREPAPRTAASGILQDPHILQQMFSLDPSAESAGEDDRASHSGHAASGSISAQVELRRMKLSHLAERELVRNFLAELTRSMRHPEQLNLLEFAPPDGRWCHTLCRDLHYTAAGDEEPTVTRLRQEYPTQSVWVLPDLLSGQRPRDFDLILAVDAVNTGRGQDAQRLTTLLSLARDGTHILLLESFCADSATGAPGNRLTIRAFEERLWEASEGRLLLDRCEIVRYPFPGSVQARALLQLEWLDS